MIELKKKTPSQIKKKKIKEEKKSIIKNYLKTNKDLSNINFFLQTKSI